MPEYITNRSRMVPTDSWLPTKLPPGILWEIGRSECTADSLVDSLLASGDLTEEQKDEVRRSSIINSIRDFSEAPLGRNAIFWNIEDIDDYFGNGDGVFDPGEKVRFKVRIGVSEGALYYPSVALSSSSGLVDFVDSGLSYNSVLMQQGEYYSTSLSNDSAEVELSSACTSGQRISVNVSIMGYRKVGMFYLAVSYNSELSLRCGKYDVVIISDNDELLNLAPLLNGRQFAWVYLGQNCPDSLCENSSPDPLYTEDVNLLNWTKSENVVLYAGPVRDLTLLEFFALGLYSYVGDVMITFGADKQGGYALNNLKGLLGVESVHVPFGESITYWRQGQSAFWDQNVVMAPQREVIADVLYSPSSDESGSLMVVGEEEAVCIFSKIDDFTQEEKCKITTCDGQSGSIVGWSGNTNGIDWFPTDTSLSFNYREASSRAGSFLLLDWIESHL